MNLAPKLNWTERLPAGLWMLLPVVALMPVWIWCAARLRDGSDDPLGIVALVALAILIVRDRARFTQRARVGWIVTAALLVALVVVSGTALPALLRAVLSVFAVCAVLMAVRAPVQPMLALTGLALLALPLLSSLQFFIGFPLRVVTAEVSRWLLAAFGNDVVRDGTALVIAGRLVMVDAPCSGIQMGWVAYFTACVAAAWMHIPDGKFLRRIPAVGAAVLIGNILRNTLLVVKEAGLVQWPNWTHDAIGVAAFTLVAVFVLWQMRSAARAVRAPMFVWKLRALPNMKTTTAPGAVARVFALATMAGVTLWPWLQPEPVVAMTPSPAIEWPRELDGRALRPLAFSAVEQRFADRFPGSVGRFTDGERAIVLRHVLAPTRMLHPATDCYRGAGYRLLSQSLEQEANAPASRLVRCFVAEKGGERLRVCENIVDARGQTFTDTSAWYWAAIMGRSPGPWRAVTMAAPL